MSYKVCIRCKFVVSVKKKLCVTCGGQKFFIPETEMIVDENDCATRAESHTQTILKQVAEKAPVNQPKPMIDPAAKASNQPRRVNHLRQMQSTEEPQPTLLWWEERLNALKSFLK